MTAFHKNTGRVLVQGSTSTRSGCSFGVIMLVSSRTLKRARLSAQPARRSDVIMSDTEQGLEDNQFTTGNTAAL